MGAVASVATGAADLVANGVQGRTPFSSDYNPYSTNWMIKQFDLDPLSFLWSVMDAGLLLTSLGTLSATKAGTAVGAARSGPAGVAAKSADNLPTVNWGHQAKHFPGHPNYIRGRSTMTANPDALIQRPGTGTPVNKVPRGEAGFKERIDFGGDIGTYVTQDGVSSPTSIGILHYRADGSVHIVPGRPQ